MRKPDSAARRVLVGGIFLLAGLQTATAATALTAQVSSSKSPAGGTAQILISLPSPHALSYFKLSMDLDPAVFGEIVTVDAFSATGDQVGSAIYQTGHVDVTVSSPLEGLGRLPNLPILALTATVLPNAAAGARATVSFQNGVGRDLNHIDYTITALPGTLTVGGSLFVARVTPGGRMLPAGTRVRIEGGGFTDSTAVRIDGVSVASTQLASAQELTITLGAPADLTGKRLMVSDPQGGQTEYYPALHVPDPAKGVRLIFPQQAYAAASGFGSPIALENPTSQPVDVILRVDGNSHMSGGSCKVTVPPLSALILPLDRQCQMIPINTFIVPAVPLPMAFVLSTPSSGGWRVEQPEVMQPPSSTISLSEGNSSAISAISWDWQSGTAPPSARTLRAYTRDLNAPFTVTASTDSGGNWLNLSATHGDTCTSLSCPVTSQFTVSANVAQLPAGNYHGSVRVLADAPYAQATVIPIDLNVSASPPIYVDSDSVYYSGAPPAPRTIAVISKGTPAPTSPSSTAASATGRPPAPS
jgi:hypothetical protein